MKRVAIAFSMFAVLTLVAWRFASSAAEPGLCELMTPSRMLENPALASEYADALRSGDSSEVARVQGHLEQIRAAHGCEGEVALPDSPHGSRLPPGHPPLHRTPATGALFEAPATLDI